MKALILAAGFGSRLMPLTQKVPKCMVEYQGKKLIDYELQALQSAGIHSIAIVGGYLFPVLRDYITQNYHNIVFYENKDYATTNMLFTLFCARDFLHKCIDEQEDILISYADIVYFVELVQKIQACNYDLGIVVDRKWRELWEQRLSDPLSDAETLKLCEKNLKIKELGKRAKDYTEIQGQYIGLFMISYKFLPAVLEFYDSLDRTALYDSKDFLNTYMTSFLQMLIDRFDNAYMIETFGNWCEIDCMSDLDVQYIRG